VTVIAFVSGFLIGVVLAGLVYGLTMYDASIHERRTRTRQRQQVNEFIRQEGRRWN